MVALTLCLPSSSGVGAGVTPEFVGREMPGTSPGILGISASAFSIASIVLFSTLVVALASLIGNRHCMFKVQRGIAWQQPLWWAVSAEKYVN